MWYNHPMEVVFSNTNWTVDKKFKYLNALSYHKIIDNYYVRLYFYNDSYFIIRSDKNVRLTEEIDSRIVTMRDEFLQRIKKYEFNKQLKEIIDGTNL